MLHPPTTYTDGHPLTARSPQGKRGQKRSARQRRRARAEAARVRMESARALAVSFAGLAEALQLVSEAVEKRPAHLFVSAASPLKLKLEDTTEAYGRSFHQQEFVYGVGRPGGVLFMYPLLAR